MARKSKKENKKTRKESYVFLIVLLFLIGISFLVSDISYKTRKEIYFFDSYIKRKEMESLFPVLMSKIADFLILCDQEKITLSFPLKIKFKLFNGDKLFVFLDIQKESDLLNVNKASETQLKEYLKNIGFSERRSTIIAESVADWIDKDDEPRFSGAEEDFYKENPYAPYPAPPNRPLQDIRELQFVKGVGPYAFWIFPGLINFVTIYAGNSKNKNIETYPKPKEGASSIFEKTGVYRLKVRIKRRGRIYYGIFIFKIQNSKVRKLFSVLM